MRALRLLLLVAPVFAPVSGCGGSPPQVPTPAVTATVAATASARPPVAIDRSPVPEPAKLAGFARVRSPRTSATQLSKWMGFPELTPEVLGRMVVGHDVQDIVDVDAPLDVALYVGSMLSPAAVTSVGVKDLQSARRVLEKDGNGYESDGFFRVEPNPDDPNHLCTLSPTAGAGGSGGRLVCGSTKAVLELTPYLTRTLAASAPTSELRAELHLANVRDEIAKQLRQLPALLSIVGEPFASSLGGVAEALVRELTDIARDVDLVSLEGKVTPAGVDGALELHAGGGQSAALTKFLLAGTAGPVPEYAQLPGAAATRFYGSPRDPAALDHGRDLAVAGITSVLQALTYPNTEAEKLGPLSARTLRLLGVRSVAASGVDDAALSQALARVSAAKTDPARKAATKAAQDVAVGYKLFGAAVPKKELAEIVEGWLDRVGGPVTLAWLGKLANKGGSKPNDVSGYFPKFQKSGAPAGLAGATHYELSLPTFDSIFGRILGDASTPPSPPSPKPRGGRPTPAPTAAKPPPPPRRTVHFIVVEDAGASWVAYGADTKLLVARLKDVLAHKNGTTAVAVGQGGASIALQALALSTLESTLRSETDLPSVAQAATTPGSPRAEVSWSSRNDTFSMSFRAPQEMLRWGFAGDVRSFAALLPRQPSSDQKLGLWVHGK